jgi:FtsX-like permease family protein
MLRLALRLALHSGREAFVRLLVTMVAVAAGVAILLSVLADFHAFQVSNRRPFWEGTVRSESTARPDQPAPNAELWRYSNDVFKGRTIERLDVAALGPDAPVPPGISRLPRDGEFYASPALSALLLTTPRDQLGDRFPGSQIGAIGERALSGPDELVVFIGHSPAELAKVPTAFRVDTIATAPGRQVWSPYFRDAFVAGALAFLFPILILIGTATRLAAARREERFAALRLVGATPRQISVVASVDATVGALLGTVLGIGIFLLIRPALADTAITSARYFPDSVTPTALGYAAVLVAVPVVSAVAALLSLRRVRISPLGVTRRTTPPPPRAWRLVPLLLGIALFIVGLIITSPRSIGAPTFPGLILILIGLVVGGPWLTAQAARVLARSVSGASTLLAARRLADNPKAAFRTVTGLVLAVFLGTVVAGLLPTVNATTATPSANALSDVLIAPFTLSPICGNTVNCNGGIPGGWSLEVRGGPESEVPGGAKSLPPANDGLTAPIGAALLAQLRGIQGAEVFPIYSVPLETVGRVPEANDATIACDSLSRLAVLGTCAPGVKAVRVRAFALYGDNPTFSTRPIAGPNLGNQPVSDDFSRLSLQSVLVKVDDPTTLERVRTFLSSHTPLSLSGNAPRTFGEAVQARVAVGTIVQRLAFIAVALTLLVAACSLAVAAGGGLVERKRPFSLLRLSGTPSSTLHRVVYLEGILPLVTATVVAAGTGYGISVLAVGKLSPKGTPVPTLGHVYYLTMGIGLAVSLVVILITLPLLNRITQPSNARFE